MKRVTILAVFIFLLMFPISAKASCNYEEQNKLNILATNINYTYKYIGDISIFDVTFHNVKEDLYLVLENDKYNPTNEKIVIKKMDSKNTNIIKIYASKNTNCSGELILKTPITLPFYNKYIETEYCKKNPYYDFCARYTDDVINNNRFMNEKINNTYDPELEQYLKTRKSETIVEKVKVVVVEIFTRNNIILMVAIVLLILIVIAAIKKLKSISKIKF